MSYVEPSYPLHLTISHRANWYPYRAYLSMDITLRLAQWVWLHNDTEHYRQHRFIRFLSESLDLEKINYTCLSPFWCLLRPEMIRYSKWHETHTGICQLLAISNGNSSIAANASLSSPPSPSANFLGWLNTDEAQLSQNVLYCPLFSMHTQWKPLDLIEYTYCLLTTHNSNHPDRWIPNGWWLSTAEFPSSHNTCIWSTVFVKGSCTDKCPVQNQHRFLLWDNR